MNNQNLISKLLWPVILIIFVIVLIISSIRVNSPTEISVITRLGNIQGSQNSGIYFLIPFIDKSIVYDTTLQSVECITGVGKNSCLTLDAATKDLQNIKIALQVSYRINPKDVVSLYSLVQDQHTFSDIIVPSAIEESVKATTAQFSAEELIQKRSEVREQLEKNIALKIEKFSLNIVSLNITNFDFSESFKKAIDEKTVAQQQILTKKAELEKIQIDNQIKISQAEAEARSIEIQNKALQSNAGYLELKKIEKWDGKLPTYYGDSGLMFNVGDKKN